MQKQIPIEITAEGMHIDLIEKAESYFFDIKRATLTPKGAELLKTIFQEIKYLPNRIIVEAHLEQQYLQGGYTSFKLSTDLANSVHRQLILEGVQDRQIQEVRGCADRKLCDPNNPLNIKNRRIRITVLAGEIW